MRRKGRKPLPNRKVYKRIGNTYAYPLSKLSRNPKDYIRTTFDKENSHLRDYYKRNKKYPWEDFEDGSWWEISKGHDYEIETLNMLRSIHVHCWRKGFRVNAYRMPSNMSIRFQIYTGKPRYLNLRDHGVYWRDVRRIF